MRYKPFIWQRKINGDDIDERDRYVTVAKVKGQLKPLGNAERIDGRQVIDQTPGRIRIRWTKKTAAMSTADHLIAPDGSIWEINAISNPNNLWLSVSVVATSPPFQSLDPTS